MPSGSLRRGLSSDRKNLFAGLALALTVAGFYAGSLQGPFVFDDIQSISENTTLRDLTSVAIWSPPPGTTASGRPLLNATLALNHAIGGDDVRGYHLVNVVIQVLGALVLFGLLHRTFARPQLREYFGDATRWVALVGAALWAVHPLQTESVMYVVQRAESLMGLFYLLTLYCFVRCLDSPGKIVWPSACVLACALGMAVKEVMVSAPVAVLLYDRTFAAETIRIAVRRRWRLYAGLVATWLVLAFVAFRAGNREGTAGFSAGATWWGYALTQCRALVHYLRLAAWPHPLVFDYGPYASPQIGDVLPPALLLGVAVVISLRWLRRHPPVGFAIAVLFLALAPTSSVFPIVTEPMAEHRMYLPLAPLAAIAAALLYRAGGIHGIIAAGVGVLALGTLTFQRHADYSSEHALWSATVAAVPKNPRAHYCLALTLRTSDAASAESHLRTALALRPDYLAPRHALAELLANNGRSVEAMAEYRAILETHPNDFVAHHALGLLAFQQGDLPAAVQHLENALRVRPASAEAHNNLGAVLYEQGNFAAAQEHEETALRLKPDYAEAHYNLGNALARQNRPQAARAAYERALLLAPNYLEAHVNLGAVLQILGERHAAIEHYRAALRIQPDNAFARMNLDLLLAAPPR